MDNYDDPNFDPDYKRYPWQNDPMEAYREIDFPKIFRELYGTDLEKPQSRHSNHQARYENPRHHYEFRDIYKEFKDSNKPYYKGYGLGIPNAQILDDVRMYPQEDDFSFKTEDDEEQDGMQKAYDQPSLEEQERLLAMEKVGLGDGGVEASGGGMHHDYREVKVTNEEQFPSGQYKYARVAEDPSEFAYPPSDPRFFERPGSTKALGWYLF